jgi:hypothetical protein
LNYSVFPDSVKAPGRSRDDPSGPRPPRRRPGRRSSR